MHWCVCTSKNKLFSCNLFKYSLGWFVVIHVYITNEKIHIDWILSYWYKVVREAFLSAWDLVALALISKLATHFNYSNTLIWRGVEKAPVGELIFVYPCVLALWVITMNAIQFMACNSQKRLNKKSLFISYNSAIISSFAVTNTVMCTCFHTTNIKISIFNNKSQSGLHWLFPSPPKNGGCVNWVCFCQKLPNVYSFPCLVLISSTSCPCLLSLSCLWLQPSFQTMIWFSARCQH